MTASLPSPAPSAQPGPRHVSPLSSPRVAATEDLTGRLALRRLENRVEALHRALEAASAQLDAIPAARAALSMPLLAAHEVRRALRDAQRGPGSLEVVSDAPVVPSGSPTSRPAPVDRAGQG